MPRHFLKCILLSSLILSHATAYGAPPPFPDQSEDKGKRGEKQSSLTPIQEEPEDQEEDQQDLDDGGEAGARSDRMVDWLVDQTTRKEWSPIPSDMLEDPESEPTAQSTQERGRAEAEPSEDNQVERNSLTINDKILELYEDNEGYDYYIGILHKHTDSCEYELKKPLSGKWKSYQERERDLREAIVTIEREQQFAREELIKHREDAMHRHQRGDILFGSEASQVFHNTQLQAITNLQNIVWLSQHLMNIIHLLLAQGSEGGPDQPELGMGAAAAPLPQHQVPGAAAGAAADLQPNPENENITIINQEVFLIKSTIMAQFWSGMGPKQTKK